jgi:hypothetical protein
MNEGGEMKKCAVCQRRFDKTDNYKKFVSFKSGITKETFTLCKEDLLSVFAKLADMQKDPLPYLEHKAWFAKEKEKLARARAIFASCSCRGSLTKNKIEHLGDKIYDCMCEKCWNKLRRYEKSIQ